MAQIGTSQFSKPAPEGYRKFSNAMIIFIIPGFITVISAWGLSDKTLAHVLLIAGYAPMLIKGIGTFLGNGQYYTTDPAKADNPPTDVKP